MDGIQIPMPGGEKKLAPVIPLFDPSAGASVCSFCEQEAPKGQYADNGQTGQSRRVICGKCAALAAQRLMEDDENGKN